MPAAVAGPVTVIVPVLGRPQNAEPFMRSLRASTGLATVYAVAEPNDPTVTEHGREFYRPTPEVLAVVNEWRTALGQDLVVTNDQPQGVMIALEVEGRDSVARNNAAIAQQNANYARQAAAVKSGQVDQKTAAMVGAVRAAQAANGLDVNSGTDLDVQDRKSVV